MCAVSSPAALSPRELAIVRLLARGRSKAQIGAQLGMSKWTVYVHLRAARERWDVDTDAELVLVAERRGLLAA